MPPHASHHHISNRQSWTTNLKEDEYRLQITTCVYDSNDEYLMASANTPTGT